MNNYAHDALYLAVIVLAIMALCTSALAVCA